MTNSDWDTFLASLVFIREPTNPILTYELPFEDYALGDPVVIEDVTELKMYYSGFSDTANAIGLATRPKTYPPITWTKQGVVLLPNSTPNQWDSGWVRMGNIFKVNGTYYLYYEGSPYPAEGGNESIGLATSSDGINFTRHASNPILVPSGDEIRVEDPTVIRVDATHWYMYYCYRTASQTLPAIRVATSPDGVVWTKVGTVLSIGASGQWDDVYIEHSQIYYAYGHYILIYEAYSGTDWACGLAYSTDPIAVFTKYSGNPFFVKSGVGGTFDCDWVATPTFFYHDGVWYLFYQGTINSLYPKGWKIGVAYAYMEEIPPTGEKAVINLGKGWGFRRWSVPQYKWL